MSASRWNGVDVLAFLEKSKEQGSKRIVRGGVARLSVGSDSHANEDDTLYTWRDEDYLPSGAVMISARKATFDDRWPYTGRRGWRPTANKVRAKPNPACASRLPFYADHRRRGRMYVYLLRRGIGGVGTQ